ncbi:MAG: hypothetical protein ACJAT4_000327 [Granulosicoccus sp.]
MLTVKNELLLKYVDKPKASAFILFGYFLHAGCLRVVVGFVIFKKQGCLLCESGAIENGHGR